MEKVFYNEGDHSFAYKRAAIGHSQGAGELFWIAPIDVDTVDYYSFS